MNDKQRIIVVIAFLLLLLYAMQRAFIMPGIESDLAALQHDNEMKFMSGSNSGSAAYDVDQTASDAEARRLEHRFQRLSVLNIFLIAGVAASIFVVVLLRSRREEGDFDEEWEDDEW